MTVASTTAPRWAVSTRTHGEVLTAGVSNSGLELVLLGVPAGFTPAEVEGWLRDLSGVAIETSRTDARDRAIPALLHHSLTGLLFSQAELWNRASAGPCSAAFVDTPLGCAFGWVGDGVVQVLVDGMLQEPRWVIVRDEEGREARATVFHPDQRVEVTIDYWPAGNDGSHAPAAVEAAWTPEHTVVFPSDSANAEAPAPSAVAEAPAESAASLAPVPEPLAIDAPAIDAPAIDAPAMPAPVEMPDALLAQEQPGLAFSAHTLESPATEPASPEVTQVVSEPAEAAASLAPDAGPSGETPALATSEGSAIEEATGEASDAPRPGHPIGRWLNRLMSWGRSAPRARESERATDSESTPLSRYDSILSDSVSANEAPVEPPQGEQTALDWHAVAPAEAEPEVAALEPQPEEASAPEASAEPVSAAPATTPGGFAFAGLAEVLGAAFAPKPVEPEPAPEPAAPPAFTHEDLVRAMFESPLASKPDEMPLSEIAIDIPVSEAPIEVDHEPVGASESFAIPPAPVFEVSAPLAPQVPVAEPLAEAPPVLRVDVPAPMAEAALPMLHVELPAPTPAPSAAPSAPAAVAPPAFAVQAPPVLHVSVPQEARVGPPVLRVQMPDEAPSAPPVLRVETGQGAAPVIIPTPPVAPIAVAEGFAPSAEPSEVSPEPVEAAPPAWSRAGWPELNDLPDPRKPWFRRPWVWGAVVAAVFGTGWLVGVLATPHRDEPGPFTKFLRAVGLGAPHYVADVSSTPPGAWIAVDGVDAARRTPARLELKPGEHTLTLTLPEMGSAPFSVRGQKGEKVAINGMLNGGLEIYPADASQPISVSVDGTPKGYAPVQIESIAPGLHEVQFTGPGLAPWAQNIHVRVRQTAQIVARPMTSPGTGIIQVQATLNDEAGSSPLSGAQVFVDGASRGVTPLSIELPRGPHSLKVSWHGEDAAVQVIDLPGGNQRFASFAFGLESTTPSISIIGASRVFAAGQTNMITAALDQLAAPEVREAWLHVRTGEGLWRRYPMTKVSGSGSAAVAAVFPVNSFDASGRTIWYVSATTSQGDEYFSEMQPALATSGASKPATPKPAASKPAAH